MRWMDDPKRSAAALSKGVRRPSFKDTPLSSLKSDRFPSLQVSCHPSCCRLLSAAHPPKAFLGGFCQQRRFLCLWDHWLGHWSPYYAWRDILGTSFFNDFGDVVWRCLTTFCRRTFEWTLRLPLFFLHADVCFTLFHQDLGWLSCLRSPTFRHWWSTRSVFHRTSRPMLLLFCDTLCHRCSFFMIECASCHRYLEPNGFSAPIFLDSVHHWWRNSGMEFPSLTHSSED